MTSTQQLTRERGRERARERRPLKCGSKSLHSDPLCRLSLVFNYWKRFLFLSFCANKVWRTHESISCERYTGMTILWEIQPRCCSTLCALFVLSKQKYAHKCTQGCSFHCLRSALPFLFTFALFKLLIASGQPLCGMHMPKCLVSLICFTCCQQVSHSFFC